MAAERPAAALAGRYRIERELGGGMSQVFLAHETGLGRNVVMGQVTQETMRAQSGGRLPATGATAVTLESLGDHEAAVALLTEAIARHDSWLLNFSRPARFDRLRKDPRVPAMLAKLEAR